MENQNLNEETCDRENSVSESDRARSTECREGSEIPEIQAFF